MSTTVLDQPTPLARAIALAEDIHLDVSTASADLPGIAGLLFWSFANDDPEQTTMDSLMVAASLDDTARAAVITQAIALVSMRRDFGNDVIQPLLSKTMREQQGMDVLLFSTDPDTTWDRWSLAVTMAHRLGLWGFQPFKVNRD